jgi:hypothetical protein
MNGTNILFQCQCCLGASNAHMTYVHMYLLICRWKNTVSFNVVQQKENLGSDPVSFFMSVDPPPNGM